MGSEIFTTARLDQLATRGDGELDPIVADFLNETPNNHRAAALFAHLRHGKQLHRDRLDYLLREGYINQSIHDFFSQRQSLPDAAWIQPAVFKTGGKFFRSRGVLSFMVLAFASLPACYCWLPEAEQLGKTGRLDDPAEIPKRLPETAQFVLDVVAEGAFEHNGNGIAACNKIRLIHSVIRHQMNQKDLCDETGTMPFAGAWADSETQPLSQELMAYTLLTFHHVVVAGLQRMGVLMDDDYIETYLHRWNVVGLMLGMDLEIVENLQTFNDTSALYDISMQRYLGPSEDGTALLNTLLTYIRNNIISRITLHSWNPMCLIPKVLTEKLAGEDISRVLKQNIRWYERLVGTLAWWGIRVIGFLKNKGWFDWLTELIIQWATAHVWDLRKDAGQLTIGGEAPQRHVCVTGTTLGMERFAKPVEKKTVADRNSLGLSQKEHSMNTETIKNWSGSVETRPAAIARPTRETEVVEIISDQNRYPSPVRAMGHYHSTTACVSADGGTIVDMSDMNRIVEITDTHVTVEAGALYQDVARELAARGRNFFINLQIGPVTLGSLATCDSKDGSAPGEAGQFGAYACAFRVALADGSIIDVDESDEQLITALRSSYGMLGIVLRVTFRTTTLTSLAVEHINFSITRFIEQLPMLKQKKASMMLYIFPFADRVTVMLRSPGDATRSRSKWVWTLRNAGVARVVVPAARIISWLPFQWLRNSCLNILQAISRWSLEHLIKATNTNPVDQSTNYSRKPILSRFSFGIQAFPESIFPQVLIAYKQFCEDYYEQHKYRPDLLNVGYRVSQSRYSLFSYSWDSDVMTIDPVGTGGPEWEKFMRAYNAFCRRYHGKPLFNQSPYLSREDVLAAYGDRIKQFTAVRDRLDPQRRLLNNHFAELLYD